MGIIFRALAQWTPGIALSVAAVCGMAQAQPAPSPARPAPAAPSPAGAAAAVPAVSQAKPGKLPLSAFIQQSYLHGALISPDGKRLLLSVAKDGDNTLAVVDSVGKKVEFTHRISGDQELNWFRFAGNDKFIFSVSATGGFEGEEIRFWRLLAADIATGQIHYIGRRSEGILGDDVLYVDPAGQYVVMSVQASVFDWPAVWRFPLDATAAKAAKLIQAQRTGVWNWFADDQGAVRMGLQSDGEKLNILYRKAPADSLKSIAILTKKEIEDQIWDVERIVSGSDEGYAFQKDAAGFNRLVKFNYSTRTAGDVVFAPANADVTDVGYDAGGKPVAAYYTDDHDRIEWLDPKMARVQRALERALPQSQVWIISRSQDDAKMIVWSGNENNPGAFFVFDNVAKKLDALHVAQQDLSLASLATPKAVDYKARDGVNIHAYLTLPPGRAAKGLPLVILPHGGPYGIRDKLDYSNEVQFLANRGYVVLQPNYRGSDGYGDSFYKLGDGQIGRAMQDDLDDGMDWLVKEGIVDAKRVCIVGSSYGGYAAVWGVIRNPDRYRCAASFAGVMNWKRQLKYQNNQESDGSERKGWSRKVRGGTDGNFDLAMISPAQQVARLTRPVLLVHGDKDTRVPFSQYKEMVELAGKANIPLETLVMPGEGHGFSRSADEEKWYASLETFLGKHNPAD